MIGEWIRFGVTALCVVGGLFAWLTALRACSALTMPETGSTPPPSPTTLALGLVLLGVMVAVGFRAVLWKLVLVLVIQWYTSPLSSHMLRNSSTGPGRRIWPAIWSCRRRRRR